ncbi:uncharacterized protein LOC130902190 [Diorhabda carinulata]|uniref:uncharacterized protein LOC130902190 n=1 Tax=Diorhabda carinulata TaxID=1163345 RepID=UPI0025A3110D|nr:uncharacterized protein LOC130902190 [Diorhabda carinulata]
MTTVDNFLKHLTTESKYTDKPENSIRSYIVFVCGVVFLTWYVQWLWNRRYLYIHSRKVPGPIGLPFIGSAYLFFSSQTSDIMKIIIDLQEKYPDIGALWFGTKLYYSVSKPEHIEKILTNSKALDKDFLYKFMTLAIGEGLLTAGVEKWRKHRKVLRPAFSQKILNAYQAIFLEKWENFAEQLQKNVGNKDVDISKMIADSTLDSICETAMGLKMSEQIELTNISETMNRMMEIITYRVIYVWHHLVFTWKLYPLSKEYDKVVRKFKNFTSTIIKKKGQAYNHKQNIEDSVAISGNEESSKTHSFLDLILENTNFTKKELQDELELFLSAGTDTTATAISNTFTVLGIFQDVQQKVLEEVLATLGPDRPVSPSDLPELKYTERVIKESLRLFPVAAHFLRKISEDIDAGDIVFPAGSTVFFGLVHIQRNPQYWPDPLKFDPDRFLPENVAKRHPCTYIPFSYGPRNCIGAQYAMMNMKTTLATVIRRFRIYTKYKTIEEIKLKINVVLRMKEGPKVWVEARRIGLTLKTMSKESIGTSITIDSTSYTEKPENIVTSYIIVVCGVVFLTWYVQWLWNRRYLYIHSRNVPGPLGLPFIGSAYLFFVSKTSDIMETLIDLQKIYPDIGALWFGTRLYYTVSKPEHIEKILTSSKALDKDSLYKFLIFVIGEGLITARGQKWKKHRKIIRPAFNQRILNAYQAVFLEKGEIFADQLQKNVGNKDMDLFELVSNCTLDIICETALGLNMNIQTENSNFSKTLDKIMEITTYRIFHVWHHLVFTWKLYPLSKEYDKVLKVFKTFTSTVIKKKWEAYHHKQKLKDSVSVSEDEESPKEKLAFLDLILENTNFTEEELNEEVELFLIAGTDTTASALSCLFTVLGMFQDVQQNVLEEILAILGPDRQVSPSDLPELKYTERVIKESLRLFPVAAFFLRKISEDIDAGDIVFPAGSTVFFGLVHIQRNPKYWPDPLKFDPDRFLPENVAKRHPCTYIPFSYGPRNCIGGQYAMMNMKTILATVLRRFRIYTKYKTIEEIKLKTNVVLRLKEGPKVWVETR